MTIPVRIEMGNHVLHTQMYALPRIGDHLDTAFPADGVPRLNLVVTNVWFHQQGAIVGKECKEPFRIVVTTHGATEPELKRHNDEAMAEAFKKG